MSPNRAIVVSLMREERSHFTTVTRSHHSSWSTCVVMRSGSPLWVKLTGHTTSQSVFTNTWRRQCDPRKPAAPVSRTLMWAPPRVWRKAQGRATDLDGSLIVDGHHFPYTIESEAVVLATSRIVTAGWDRRITS